MTHSRAQSSIDACDTLPGSHCDTALIATPAAVVPAVDVCTDPTERGSDDLAKQPGGLRKHIKGQASLMATHGSFPYTLPQAGTIGYIFNGVLEATIGGVPLIVDADMTSMVPIYGKANSIRVHLDKGRLDDIQHTANASSLDSVGRACERIDDLKDACKRRSLALQHDLDSARAAAVVPDTTDNSLPIDAPNGGAILPTDSLNEPTPSVPHPSSGAEGLTIGSAPVLSDAPGSIDQNDSLQRILGEIEQTQRMRDSLESLSADLHRQKERLTAMVNARQRRTPLFSKFISGFDRLELGDCAPNAYTFLLSGTRFQGVSALYDIGGVKVALDHGRTPFGPTIGLGVDGDALRALQRSFFLLDDDRLPSRRLTAIGLSTGADKLSMHVGYLRAEGDSWTGSDMTSSAIETPAEHVVELGVDKSFLEHHRVGIMLARAVLPKGTAEGEVSSKNTDDVLDASAVQLDYAAEIPASSARLTVQARVTGPYFRSLGAGFLRRDERKITLGWSQRANTKFDYKLKADWRKRSAYVPGGPVVGSLRGMAAGAYRVGRAVKLRATYAPLWAQSAAYETAGGPTVFSQMIGVGADYRVRRRKTTLSALVNLDMYMRSTTGRVNTAYHVNGFAQCLRQTGDAFRLAYSAFVADTVGAVEHLQQSITGEVVLTVGTATRAQGAVTLGLGANEALGWSLGLEHPLSSHFSLVVKGQRNERPMMPVEGTVAQVEQVDCGWQIGLNVKF